MYGMFRVISSYPVVDDNNFSETYVRYVYQRKVGRFLFKSGRETGLLIIAVRSGPVSNVRVTIEHVFVLKRRRENVRAIYVTFPFYCSLPGTLILYARCYWVFVSERLSVVNNGEIRRSVTTRRVFGE